VATRDLANRRIALLLGADNALTSLQAPAIDEANAMLPAHRAVRWDGYDMGMQESDQIDDRTLDDDAAATIAGFIAFGGALPVFYPKRTDTTSILRLVFNLLKAPRTKIAALERVGFANSNDAIAAGDNVNTYRLMTDGFKPDTEGTGGYAYIVNLLAQGDAYPWTIVPAASPAAVAIVGGLTLALAVGEYGLRGATYQSNNIANRATWTSSDETVATVDNRGIVKGISAGTANIVATFPGGSAATPCVVTVT